MNRNGQQPRSRIYDLTFQLPLSLLSSRKYLWTSICTPYTLQLSNHFGVNATLSSSSSEKLQDDPKSGLLHLYISMQMNKPPFERKTLSGNQFMTFWAVVRAAIKDERWHLLLARVHSCHFTWIASSESISSELPGRLLTSRNLIARYSLQHFGSSKGPPA